VREPSSKYQMIPRASHVSILFSKKTFAELRAWTSQLLGTNPDAPFPRNMPALGCMLGIVGLSILVPPFLRQIKTVSKSPPQVPWPQPSFINALSLVFGVALGVAVLLALRVIPFHFVRLFHGDYLAVFLCLSGLVMLVFSYKSLLKFPFPTSIASTAASALVLVLLFAGWFELTFYEAWLTPARWFRFPLVFLLLLPWHFAEEILLGQPTSSPASLPLFKPFSFPPSLSFFIF